MHEPTTKPCARCDGHGRVQNQNRTYHTCPTCYGTRVAGGLFWNNRGEVCCQTHAPYYRSDTWNSEGWQPVPTTDPDPEVAAELRRLACECCEQAKRVAAKREKK